MTEKPKWAEATPEDIRSCDIDFPISDFLSTETWDIQKKYTDHIAAQQNAEDENSASVLRAYLMVSGVLGLGFDSSNRMRPFSPRVQWADGRRSADIEDFGACLPALVECAEKTNNLFLRARANDIVWMLDRARHQSASKAICAYVELSKAVSANREVDGGDSIVRDTERASFLVRAIQIAGAVRKNQEDCAIEAFDLLAANLLDALARKSVAAVRIFAEAELKWGREEPLEVARRLEEFALDLEGQRSIEFWRMARSAYQTGKDQAGRDRCKIKASELLAAQAEEDFARTGSAIMAAHWLGVALAELEGVPSAKDKRRALRKRVLEVQRDVPDEFSTFSTPIDLTEISKSVQAEADSAQSLFDLFGLLTAGVDSPKPERLIEKARALAREHPLSSMFGANFYDTNGTIRHKSEGSGLALSNSGLDNTISQSEDLRRMMAVYGHIDVVRRDIHKRFNVGSAHMDWLCENTFTVPPQLSRVIGVGLMEFIAGNSIPAAFILIPMMEPIIRHVLELTGNRAVDFDDAAGTQKETSLSSMFENHRADIEKVFGQALTRDIESVFLKEPGPTLRHAIAHGRTHDAALFHYDTAYACALVFKVCFLPLVSKRLEVEPLLPQ